MSKTQVKGSDSKVKRSTSKPNVDHSPKLKKDDSKVKKDDPKLKKDDSKLKKDDPKLKKDDSKLKKDDPKAKKEESKGKSDTKLKDSKSKDKIKPASGATTPSINNKASGKSLSHVDEGEHAITPADHPETVESQAPSPALSKNQLALDKDLHDEEKEPDFYGGDNPDKRKRSAPSSEASEKKANKDKDIASPKDRRSEEENDMKKISSRTKYDEDHTPEDGSGKRSRSRTPSKEIKEESGKMDVADECDYKKKKKSDSADSGSKKDKQGRNKRPQNNETADSDVYKKDKYKQPERSYKKEKSWESRDDEGKRTDTWKSEDSDYKEESDYKKSRDWKTRDRDYEKPWPKKDTDFRIDKESEHPSCTFKKKPWRCQCGCKKDKSWEDDHDDYKKAYSFWKNRDRLDYSSSHYRKQEQSPKSYNTFDEEMSRPRDAKPERSTCNCQCASCRPKYIERSKCMCSKNRQPDKYSAMSKEPDYRPQAMQAFQFVEKPERKTCCAIRSAVSPAKTCCRAPPCVHRQRPFQELQSCCPKKCCGQSACPVSRRKISPSANAGYVSCAAQSQCYKAPERTCYANPALLECLPRRLSCTILRPTSCPARANEFGTNHSELVRTCQPACEYDRCTFTRCCGKGPGNASPSYTNYGSGSSWDRMQPKRPTVSKNFGLSTQPKSCMDFATKADQCGCGKSLSQQLLTNPKKVDSFSNSISLKSDLPLRSRPKNIPFGEVSALSPSSNFYCSTIRSRNSSYIASKSDQVTGSAALQSGASPLPKKESLIASSQSYHSKLNSFTRDCKSCSVVERSPVSQSHSYLSKRYSSFNYDNRDHAYDVGFSNRSLTDRDLYSPLASNADLKSISSYSPSGSYGL